MIGLNSSPAPEGIKSFWMLKKVFTEIKMSKYDLPHWRDQNESRAEFFRKHQHKVITRDYLMAYFNGRDTGGAPLNVWINEAIRFYKNGARYEITPLAPKNGRTDAFRFGAMHPPKQRPPASLDDDLTPSAPKVSPILAAFLSRPAPKVLQHAN